tara:strand:+ start:140 stop:340 length:201 start_codon:yes stop_codon:yes gene_type:complete
MTKSYNDKLCEQIDSFQFQLENTIKYYMDEFDIPFHAIVGVLEEVKKDFLDSASEIVFEIEEDEDE